MVFYYLIMLFYFLPLLVVFDLSILIILQEFPHALNFVYTITIPGRSWSVKVLTPLNRLRISHPVFVDYGIFQRRFCFYDSH